MLLFTITKEGEEILMSSSLWLKIEYAFANYRSMVLVQVVRAGMTETLETGKVEYNQKIIKKLHSKLK